MIHHTHGMDVHCAHKHKHVLVYTHKHVNTHG